MNEQNQQSTFWTTGYLPNGCKVSFTIPTAPNGAAAYMAAVEFTNALLAAGFRMDAPNLNDGEHEYTVTHVARRTQKSKKDNSVTPLIDFYHDNLNFSALKTWLNTPEQIADFERATGLQLVNLKPFPGTAAIKRGESDDADAFVIKLAHPVKVIWKQNPDYEEGSTTQSKREFVRFGETVAAPTSTQQQQAPATEPELELVSATFTVLVVQTLDRGNTVYYQLATGKDYVYAFNRDVFREVGYSDKTTDAWKKAGFSLKLPEPFQVTAIRKIGSNGKEYWHAVTTDELSKLKQAS